MVDGKAAKVRRLALFTDSSRSDIDWICRIADLVDVPTGTTLLLEGETVREVAIVVDGVASSDDVVFGPGSCFGASEVAAGRSSTMNIEARTPVRLLVFGVREFRALARRIPSLGTRLVPNQPHPVEPDLMLRAVS